MNTQDEINIQSLKGRSLPSTKYGAWIVDQVSGTIDGRSRLVTADLKGEQWVWTVELVHWFKEIDSPVGKRNLSILKDHP